MKPLLVDLFCGAGIGADGYAPYFDIVGVDKYWQRRNPYRFVHLEAYWFLDNLIRDDGMFEGRKVSVIHASPPCQAYSNLRFRQIWDYVDLIEGTRTRLEQLGVPYVIENIENAPLRNAILLCGTMFPGLRVIRHRKFESNVKLRQPEHIRYQDHPPVYSLDKRRKNFGKLNPWKDFVTVTGGGNTPLASSIDAMQVKRTTRVTQQEITEAIPPAYTEFIAQQLLSYVA